MNIQIKGESIKVGQFLKKIGFIDSCGAAKSVLKTTKILINNKLAIGRSSKIKPGDTVWINDKVYFVEGIDEKEN